MTENQLLEFETERVRVAIVDDHDAIRLGFKGACLEYGFDLLASEATVDALLARLDEQSASGENDETKCQVAVLDLSLADGSLVADNVDKLVSRNIPVLIFSIADNKRLNTEAIRAGATAIVPKSESMQELARSIRLTANGIIVNNTQTAAAIHSDLEFKDAKLSPRERDVLGLYASGLSLKQVASHLGIKIGTAKDYIDRVRAKFAVVGRPARNKTELVIRAIEEGLLDDPAGNTEGLM